MLYRHCFSTLIKIRKVQESQLRLKLNRILQLLLYGDYVYVNILGDNIDTTKKNIETVTDTS
jgi:hypothetical protein